MSATGRDIILKPMLYILDNESLKVAIDEWTTLILDTYKKLKKESTIRQNYGQQQSIQAVNNERKLINQYFGELEIRGLINISYYALYYNEQLD